MRAHEGLLASSALFLIALEGCRPVTHSDVKALDNFAGSNAVHSCSGPYQMPASAKIEQNAAFHPLVKAAMSAVPTNLQDVFFEALKGKIVVTSDIAKFCGEKTISCWRGETQGPTIYINASKQDIGHATVRSFGYFVSEELLKGADQMEPKSQVGKAFLTDVANSSGQYNLAKFRLQLDGAVLEPNLSEAQRNQRLNELPPLVHAVARDVFYDYALAEAFDSWYCDNSTNASMLKRGEFMRNGQAALNDGTFVRSGQAIQKVIAMLQDVTLASIANEEKSEGLALFGRYRNGGPIRNIIARRQDGYGIFQGNGPVRRTFGANPAPRWQSNFGGQRSGSIDYGTQIKSSQYATAQQIANTAPQSYSNGASYNGGDYRKQSDGSYGWFPAGSAATFQPTYFQTRNADSSWVSSGSLAPTATQAAKGVQAIPTTTTVTPVVQAAEAQGISAAESVVHPENTAGTYHPGPVGSVSAAAHAGDAIESKTSTHSPEFDSRVDAAHPDRKKSLTESTHPTVSSTGPAVGNSSGVGAENGRKDEIGGVQSSEVLYSL